MNDGSRDYSAKIIEATAAREPEIVGVLLNRNYGQHAAVLAGLAEARGDVVVTLDADLQNPPEEIPKLFQKFARIASPSTSEIPGTGLGLYLARELCAANRAVLEYVREASGAHFRVVARSPAKP